MKKEELIERIRGLKSIKPEENWLILSKKQVLAQMRERKQESVKAPIFVFSWGYKLGAAVCAFVLLFSGVAAMAASASVDSPLYSVKIALEKTLISLAPANEQMDLQLFVTQQIINDLTQTVGSANSQLAIETINQNLNEIASQLHQIAHPSEVAAISEKVQKDVLKIKEELQQVPTDKPEIASSLQKLNNQVASVESDVFALKNEAEEKINNCPVYLEKLLVQIENQVNDGNLPQESKEKILNQLKETDEYLVNGRCVDALVILDNLQKQLGN